MQTKYASIIGGLALVAALLGAHLIARATDKPAYQYSENDRQLMQACIAHREFLKSPDAVTALTGCTLVILDPETTPAERAQAYRTRAVMWWASWHGDWQKLTAEIAQELGKGIALAPADVWKYYHLRALMAFHGKGVSSECPDGALADFTQAVAHYNGESAGAEVYAWRAVCLAKRGDVQGAVQDYEMAIKLDPMETFVIRSIQASILLEAGAGGQAIEIWERYVASAPDSYLLQAHYVDILSQLEASAKVVEVATAFLARHPTNGMMLLSRGNAYHKLGDKAKALADWKAADALGKTLEARSGPFSEEDWQTMRAGSDARMMMEGAQEVPITVEPAPMHRMKGKQ